MPLTLCSYFSKVHCKVPAALTHTQLTEIVLPSRAASPAAPAAPILVCYGPSRSPTDSRRTVTVPDPHVPPVCALEEVGDVNM